MHDISFIVIALDEAFAIQKCLESIYRLDTQNCELICVDSNSEDNTLQIMKEYAEKIPNTRIFKINGDRNAAISRNIGIKHATKDYLFFIDGDVEISETFLSDALKELPNFSAVHGDLEDVEYDTNYQRILHTKQRYAKRSKALNTHTGGIFLTKKNLVSKIGLFDESLVINEDVDFSLRLGELEPILYIPISMGKHHTVPFTEPKKLLQKVKMQHGIYTGMLLKKQFRNESIVSFFRTQSDLFFGLPFFVLTILCGLGCKINPYALTIPLLIFCFDIKYGLYQKKNLTHRIIIHYLNPLFVLKGFLGCFKKKRLQYTVERVF